MHLPFLLHFNYDANTYEYNMTSENNRKFTSINETFQCTNCKKEVPTAKTGCRNHCPYCLTSLHVDINPGDRSNPCKGVLNCTGYELSKKKGLILIFTCKKCGQTTRNKAMLEDPVASDDYDLILSKSHKNSM